MNKKAKLLTNKACLLTDEARLLINKACLLTNEARLLANKVAVLRARMARGRFRHVFRESLGRA